MAADAVVIHPDDNVAVVVREIKNKETITTGEGLKLEAVSEVPRNHKIALQKIPEGSAVIKYGEKIGFAATKIDKGEWVHTHNMKSEGE